ncbi:MAG: DNA polymerase IV [Cyclobacteriaceae bacterium]|nr:DNA polymerase IV [Cyclobacteriaceae bacterium]
MGALKLFNTTDAVSRSVLHMDLDAFFVSVECLRDRRLSGRPLIIGGRSDRGVVAACSYEARTFGVHSAMPVKLALQLCPDALIISGDMEAYSRFSGMVTEIIRESAPMFEKASIDEFYLDLTGMDRFFGCYQWASELRHRIMKETHLPISMGLSINKLVSKVATGEAKPNGQAQVVKGEERSFLAPLSVRKIPMIGKKTADFLYEMGITRVNTLCEMPVEMLEAALGKNGRILWNRAHGIDNSPVVPYVERKSISTETTFENDTIDVKKLRSVISGMTEKLAFLLRKENKLTACISVKIRYSDFETVSRQSRLSYTSSDRVLIGRALDLFDKLYSKRLMIRLVGVRLSELAYGSYQISLFDDTEEEIRLNDAMDRMRIKYGASVLTRASSIFADPATQHADTQELYKSF